MLLLPVLLLVCVLTVLFLESTYYLIMTDSEKLDCLTAFVDDLIFLLHDKGVQIKMEYEDEMFYQECKDDADKYRQMVNNILFSVK